ncbi:MAG: diaminopimelate epimerase, partial [Caldimicrobium sp.]
MDEMCLKELFDKIKKDTFYKVSASGNDFIVYLNYEGKVTLEEGKVLAQRLCRPKFSVSADGFIMLEKPNHSQAQLAWKFYNADGSIAEMCGNGARAVARLAHELGLVKESFYLETLAGLIFVEVKNKRAKISLGVPKDLRLDLIVRTEYDLYLVHYANTGVPHIVLFWDNVDEAPIQKLAPILRYHENFKPAGTNVNFVEIVKDKDKTYLKIRTYERGVEAETLACGTGASAAAYIAYKQGLLTPPIEILTKGGEILIVEIDKTTDTIYLEGDTQYLYQFTLF